MQLLEAFKSYIKKEDLFQPKDKLLVAVSGGSDSVVLCDLCYQAGFTFAMAHCNFQLRGDESERDESFIETLSKKYAAQLFTKRFDTGQYAQQNKVSIQLAARELRYAWFKELLTSHKLSWILTAHQADDNVETLLMNFFKGTGINGLKSISPKNDKVVRPLLFAMKEVLIEYAVNNALPFVEDSSNNEDKYTRNYFRHQVIPAVARVFPQVEQNLSNNIIRFEEIRMLYMQAVQANIRRLVEKKENEWHIPVLKLQQAVPQATIIYELFKQFGFSAGQVDDITNLLSSESGKFIASGTHRVFKNRKWLIITPDQHMLENNIIVEDVTSTVPFDKGVLTLQLTANNSSFKLPVDTTIACLDASVIKFPLLLRRWKQGDYFYPLGMQKKKKLSRFFIDQKMSVIEKEKTWVLEMDNKIVWIVGRRIDNRFRIGEHTTQVIEIRQMPGQKK